MLTKNQLKQLRKEIVLNSLFLNDYNNSLFIKNKTVCAFMDSYIEYLYEIAHENNFKSDNIIDVLNEYDNIENLYNYYLCYDDDPLLQNDYIAVLTLSYFHGIVIYSIDDYSVIVASYYNDGCNNVMHINRITKNNIFYNNTGDPYINKDGYKYYLNDFIKVSNN